MNVFYVSMASANNVVMPHSKVWEINLKETLLQMGHCVIEPGFDSGQMARECMGRVTNIDPVEARTQYSQRIVDDVRRTHSTTGIDLFFSYFYSAMILTEAVQSIRALGVPTVNFYCNSIHQFHLIKEIAPYYDYCMFPEREAEPRYVAVGANPVHVQMAANPRFYRPYAVAREYPVTFVGQKYLNREEYVHHLFANGLDVRVWGPGWQTGIVPQLPSSPYRRARGLIGLLKHRLRREAKPQEPHGLPRDCCGPPLSDEELVKMYSRSLVSLGFSEVQDPLTGEIKRHIRLRDFEAPMSGAFYLVGYQEELAEYYELDKEIVCYYDRDDLLDKVRYYLDHEHEAERIRQAGLARARRDHSWENRFAQLFEVIGLRADRRR